MCDLECDEAESFVPRTYARSEEPGWDNSWDYCLDPEVAVAL